MPNWKKVITSGSNAALNSLTVTSGITGTLTGNASTATSATSATTATTATNANNINISATTSADTATSVVLVANQSTGNQSPFIDSGLTYNADTNALTATTFVGALSGNATTSTTATSATTATTATNATNVNTGLVTTNATHYIPFVNSNNNPASAEALGTVATLTYNPNTGVFNANIISGSAGIHSDQDVTAEQNLRSIFSSGDEGGEIFLNKAATNTTLNSGVTIDVNQNKLRIFEHGGTNRGYYLDISAGGASVGTNLASGGGTVTSVSTAGTVSGITLTGGPITGAGTITLGGSISGALSGIPSISNPGGAISIGSGMSLTGLTSVTVNPGSSSNPVGLSGSIFLPNIGTATKSNVIYYDTTTKQLTYGATPTGTVTSIATNNGVTGGTITSTGTIGLTGQALALHNLATNGLIARTGAGTVAGRTLTGTANQITVTNGDGVSGNPTISLPATITGLTSVTSTGFTGALTGNASTATTATNATNVAVTDTTTGTGPYYLMFADGTTGNRASRVDSSTLTFNATTNTLTVTNLAGNATSATTATTATTANATTAALTAGTYLTSGGTFNGSTARTFAVDATSTNTVSKVVARDSSGNFSAGTITATLSGNASTATSASFATAANTINITTQNTTPVTYNVTFAGGTSGQQSLNVDASTLTYNPSTTTLSTGTVVANLTGNASTATYATSAGSAGVVSGNASPNVIYLGGHESLSSSEALTTSQNGELYWDPSARGVVFHDLGGTSVRTIYGQIPASAGEGFIDSQGGRMYYYSNQHIFGDNSYGYSGQFNGSDFDAGGNITCGGTKFFDIAHQTKQGWGLKHAAIEGPESGVYYRGKLSGSDKIELPEYWKWLVHEDTITVTLTPVGQYQALYVKDIKDNEVYIGSDGDFVNCHYVVYGERKDVERWDVEYENYSRNEK